MVAPEDILTTTFPPHSIATASGRIVDPWNMAASDFSITDIAMSLAKLCRYAGHVPSFYSVAEHCVWVYGAMVDLGVADHETLVAGFMHDAAEAYLVDMPSPVKNQPAMKPYRDAEVRIQEALGERYGFDLFEPRVYHAVHKFDKAAYVWETNNVRTGKVLGLGPVAAEFRYRDVARFLDVS